MHRVPICLAFFVLSLTASAVPRTVGYQGRLLDAQDAPVNGPVKLTLRFFAERVPGAGETALHTETFDTIAAGGLVAVELGREGFPDGLFTRSELWLEAQVEDGPPLQPRMRFASVPFAHRAGLADEALTAAVADEARALTPDAKVPAGQIEGAVEEALQAATATSASSADVAKALTQDARLPASQIDGKVAGAQDSDKLEGRSFAELESAFAAKSHTHDLSELTTGVLAIDRIADGSISAAKLAPDAVSGSAITPTGDLEATTVGEAIAELEARKVSSDSLPLAPNYLRDTRHFRQLALDANGAEVLGSYVDLSNAGPLWQFTDYASETKNGSVGSAQVRRVTSETLRQNPSSFTELGNFETLLKTLSRDALSPNYSDFSVVEFKVDVSGTGSGKYQAAFLRQGCHRFNGAYSARVPSTTSALVKIIQLGTNQSVRIAGNSWPSTTYSGITSDWVALNAQQNHGGGCIDLFSIDCEGACTGTVRFALALPYVSAGLRTGVAWAGYAHYLMDDMPRRTRCKAPSNTPYEVGTNIYTFKQADCTHGLPVGDCQAFLSRASASGRDEDWRALRPGESNGPGVSWWMETGGTSLDAVVEYLCY